MSVRLFLFGAPRIALHGGSVALGFERRSQLLAHLAMRRGWVPRAELAAMMWPSCSAENAHMNLRKTLMRLRTLPWAPAILVQEQALSFQGNSDVVDFEAAIVQRRWADALKIADAPLLTGFDDEASDPWSAWLNTERDRLRSAWRTAVEHCLAAATVPADMLSHAARLLEDDPLDESALRARMTAHTQLGQPARARAAYQLFAARLAHELGTAPSAQLQALHDSLNSGSAPIADALSPPAGGVDKQLVGRLVERRDIRQRLDQGYRLLCLIGPGGVGKSCLARHMLWELSPLYPDGAAFVPLDDVKSPDEIGARLARELAVPLRGGSAPLQDVIAFLRGRRTLLVLDNFEHLKAAAPQLQSLLDACPRLQMLVTSRVRLGLAAEHSLPLDGLPCPAPEDADCLEAFDAAQLFVRVARAVEPALNPAVDAAAIVDICCLVDGLPLALEIAAGWTRILPCKAIAAELRQGLALLTETNVDRPERHASMAAVFEQSWRRLSPIERDAWARLTVFHGGFTLDAAGAVTGAALPVLAALIDQSLLRKTHARADLHPLLRQLVATHLADDERLAACAAHGVYYLRWLVSHRHELKGGDKQTLQQIDIEFENVRAAWRWAAMHGPVDALQSAALLLMRFCDLRGRHQEGLSLLRDAAAGVGANDARLRPLLDVAIGRLEYRLGRHAEAELLAKHALRASRATRDHDTRLLCFITLGSCAQLMGRGQTARRRYRQALAEAASANDLHSAAGMLQNLATVEQDLGHYDAALELYTRSLVEHRRLHDAIGEALCLSNLATLELDTNQVDAAAGHLEAGLALCERHAITTLTMVVLTNLTDVSVRRNDAAATQRHGQRALELAEQIGARGLQCWLQLHFAQLWVQQREFIPARDALRAAAEHAIELGHAALQLDCVLGLTELLAAQGAPAAAIRLSRYAIDHPATRHAHRNRARDRLADWSSQIDAAALRAPAVDLWTLMHRIVAETPAAHALLIESLRAP